MGSAPQVADASDRPAARWTEVDDEITVSGPDFSLVFDRLRGEITSYRYGYRQVLRTGPAPEFWRAPTDNDFGSDAQIRGRAWKDAGENRTVDSVRVAAAGVESSPAPRTFPRSRGSA